MQAITCYGSQKHCHGNQEIKHSPLTCFIITHKENSLLEYEKLLICI